MRSCGCCGAEMRLVFEVSDLGRFYQCSCGEIEVERVQNKNWKKYLGPIERLKEWVLFYARKKRLVARMNRSG